MRCGPLLVSGMACAVIACTGMPSRSSEKGARLPELAGSPREHRPTKVDAAVRFTIYPFRKGDVTPCPGDPAARCLVYEHNPFRIRFAVADRHFAVPSDAYNMTPRGFGPNTPWYKVPTRGSLTVHIDYLGAEGDTLSQGAVTIPLAADRAWSVTVSISPKPLPGVPPAPCLGCSGASRFPITGRDERLRQYELAIYWGWVPVTGRQPPSP